MPFGLIKDLTLSNDGGGKGYLLQVFRQVEGEWLASTAILWASSVYGRMTWMQGSSSSQSKSSSSEVGIPSWVEQTGGPQKPCLIPNASQSSKSQFSSMFRSLTNTGIFSNPSTHGFFTDSVLPDNHLHGAASGVHLAHPIRDLVRKRPPTFFHNPGTRHEPSHLSPA